MIAAIATNLIMMITILRQADNENTLRVATVNRLSSSEYLSKKIVKPIQNHPKKTMVGTGFTMAGIHIFLNRDFKNTANYNDPIINLYHRA